MAGDIEGQEEYVLHGGQWINAAAANASTPKA